MVVRLHDGDLHTLGWGKAIKCGSGALKNVTAYHLGRCTLYLLLVRSTNIAKAGKMFPSKITFKECFPLQMTFGMSITVLFLFSQRDSGLCVPPLRRQIDAGQDQRLRRELQERKVVVGSPRVDQRRLECVAVAVKATSHVASKIG